MFKFSTIYIIEKLNIANNSVSPDPTVANSFSHGPAVKSDIFVDKISDRRIFSRDFRLNTNKSPQNLPFLQRNSSTDQLDSINRLKQQIYSQYNMNILNSTSPKLRANSNQRKSNLSIQSKSSVNFVDSNANFNGNKSVPTSILKQSQFKKANKQNNRSDSRLNNHTEFQNKTGR